MTAAETPLRTQEANQSLSNALNILDLLRLSLLDLGVREMSRELGLAPSIVHRLLVTLRSKGYIEQDSSNHKYRIGRAMMHAGNLFSLPRAVYDAVFEELNNLSHQIGMSGYLAVMRSRQVIYVVSTPARFIPVNTSAGEVTHLHATAVGKILLSAFDPRPLEALVRSIELPRKTSNTITSPRALIREVNEVRRSGVAFCLAENVEEIFAIGIPLRNARGDIIAGMSLATEGLRAFTERRELAQQCLFETAARMARLSETAAAASEELER